MSFDLDAFLADARQRIDAALDEFLPPAIEPPSVLHEAMRYAVFSGGKRLRPALAFASVRACGAADEAALPVALAVELIHAYSLVHDDLPAMDDAEERRGRPCVHVKFGEANAVLVGDALLPAAFDAIASKGGSMNASAVPHVVAALAHAAGSRSLVGGQVDDLALHLESATLDEVVAIHESKTAALFRFATSAGARLAGASGDVCKELDRFGLHYGLAFQAVDDLLDADVTECSILLVSSPADARAHVERHIQSATESLASLGDGAEALRALAEGLG